MAAKKMARGNKDALFEEGLKVRKEVLTAEYVDRQFASASEFTLPMQEMATRAWGLVWARPGLPHKTRSMLNIAFLIALDKPEELELHVQAARRNGVTADEVLEILMQAAVYCGFPAALRGTRIARQALERYDSEEAPKKRARPKARR
ncbi:MAG TPA: carboxymuconolactone decarboxylase family protein [Burkholderiales bacterium]|jgi:4-carboxymuconolactone decarboxylase|nr:carboxymuconolactone decarboxylase family protein [Burkholderiales bacterium]